MLTYAGMKFDPEGQGELVVLGLPSDMGADTRTGQANAPTHMRYHSVMPEGSFPYTPWSGTAVDAGDVMPETRDNNSYIDSVRNDVSELADDNVTVYTIGGDDSVSYGVILGLTDVHETIGVLHYDAHVDMDVSDSLGVNHSNWVTYAREVAPFQQRFCREISMAPPANEIIPNNLPLLLSIDMDVFDPAYAPGVAVPVPFGPTPREILADIGERIRGRRLVGINVTEILPERDPDGRTAVLACYLVNRILAGVS